MIVLIVFLVLSVALNVALIVGAIFNIGDSEMEILMLREKLRAQ